MVEAGFLEQLDTAIANFLRSWNIWTTLLAGILFIVLIWPILTGRDPDIHPFILARQAHASPIRQEGQSAVFRSYEVPYGYPLRKGLAIKDPEAPKWSSGRDGDLRDIWRAAARGPVDDNGSPIGPAGRIFTIHGKDDPSEHKLAEITKAINAVGKHIQESGGKTVAVYLSNSVELIASIFAAAFYGFKPVLLPYGISQGEINSLLSQTKADHLIAAAGSVELSAVNSAVPSIRHIIWVAQAVNKHLDWNEVPAGIGGKIELYTWHDLIEERKESAKAEVPALETDSTHAPIATFAPTGKGGYELVEYSVENMIAATASARATIARASKLTHHDIVFPTTPLTDSYTFSWILAALLSNSSLAVNSVAGESVDITASIRGIKPTIIITSSGSVSRYTSRLAVLEKGLTGSVNKYFARRSLASGVFPPKSPFAIKSNPNLSTLRLLLIAQSIDTPADARLSSTALATLRLALGVRVGYALTAPKFVAGAISQSNILDYRVKGNNVNVGAPLTSCEVFVTGDEGNVGADQAKGKLNVTGPSVVGESKVNLGIDVEIDADHTINLL